MVVGGVCHLYYRREGRGALFFCFFLHGGDDKSSGYFFQTTGEEKLEVSAQQEGGLRGGSPVPRWSDNGRRLGILFARTPFLLWVLHG